MKRTALCLSLWAAAAVPAGAQTLYVSPDVPTDPALGTDFLPWEGVEHMAAGFTGVALTIPGEPQVDALHKMDQPGHWLFSIEAPNDLAGALGSPAEPRDVIRSASGVYSRFFCGGSAVDPVPLTSDVDVVYLDPAGGDHGDLLLSFDVPTTIGATTFEPADIVRYRPTAANPACADWKLVGIEFDASAAGAGILPSSNLIGADTAGGLLLLSFDIPTDLNPSLAPNPYLPGQIASWNGLQFDLYESLTAWPLTGEVDALSSQANPGTVPVTLMVAESGTPGDLTLSWSPSCSQGAEDYGVYEGTISSIHAGVYDHVQKDCMDAGGDRIEDVTPPGGVSTYYLVVARTSQEEGSYGVDWVSLSSTERPQPPVPANRCITTQLLSPCP